MLLRTLGQLELEGSSLRRPKPLLLLAYLALEGPQERGHLAELFFRGNKKARANLSVALSRLRKGAPRAIRTGNVRVWSEVRTDTGHLLEALEKGETQQGLSLYTGPFLEGVSLDELGNELAEWVYGTRDYLASQVQKAQLNLAESEAAKGRYAQAAKCAESAYKLAPMTADPDTLGRLHTLLLAGGSLIETKLREEADFFDLPLCQSQEESKQRLLELFSGKESPPTNLRARETSFVGRDLELAEITQLLSEHRLVTLLGPGGVGKSRLAAQTAQQQLGSDLFKDGIFFVALDALTSIRAIPTSIASAVSLILQGSDDPLAQLKRYLADKQMLLVLDNFEHLVEGAILVSELLAACPELSLLITSRERLNLEEEWIFKVGGLSYSRDSETSLEDARHFDAVRLFIRRAQQARPKFALENNLRSVLKLCQLLDGVPLALELAATWTRVMSCEEIVRELGQSLDLLTTATRNLPDKHRSMRASFDHSWRLLSKEEQSALAKLSVFRGGFTREAAREVAETGLSRLASLSDKSLLTVTERGRYDSHPLVCAFCREKLPGEDVQVVRKRHAEYYSNLGVAAGNRLRSDDQAAWLSQLAHEHGNVVETLRLLRQDDPERGLTLVVTLEDYWFMKGYWQFAASWLKTFLALTPQGDAGLRARATLVAGKSELWNGHHNKARALLEASLNLSRRVSDHASVAKALNVLGNVMLDKGHAEKAKSLFEESLGIRRQCGDLRGVAGSLNNLGAVALEQGCYDEAKTLFEESLSIRKQRGDRYGTARSLNNLGNVFSSQGHYAEARTQYEESLKISGQLGDQRSVAVSLENLGSVAFYQGHIHEAQTLYLESLKIFEQLDDRLGTAHVFADVAALLSRTAKPYASVKLYAASAALCERLGVKLGTQTVQEAQQSVEQVCDVIGKDQFDLLLEEGKKLSRNEATELAFAELGTVTPQRRFLQQYEG